MPDDRLLHRRAGHSQKVTMLTYLEHRVWTQYLLSADDFGVMRCSAIALQADNDALAARKPHQVARALDRLVVVALLDVFEHQAQRYVYQRDWQSFQRIRYPRGTTKPRPPDELLGQCDQPTRDLFAQHPGGRGRSDPLPERSRNGSETDPERSGNSPEVLPPRARTSAPAGAKRLTPNGNRLTATGSEGGLGETILHGPPVDAWARELAERYPQQATVAWNRVERPLYQALTTDGTPPTEAAWHALLKRLDGHMRSHQWGVKRMIPRLDRWLSEGLHLQALPADPPIAERLSKRTSTTLAGAAEIMAGPDEEGR